MPEDFVPTKEDILGHWFDGCKVWMVFRAPRTWAGTLRVAETLRAEGAIDGRTVKELVEPA